MAKKRYYQSKKDRMDESRGEYKSMAKKAYKKADYDYAMSKRGDDMRDAGYDKRRAALEDSYMIREDRNAIANLPQKAFTKKYPGTGYLKGRLNDTISGIDDQMGDDHSEMMRHLKPEKY